MHSAQQKVEYSLKGEAGVKKAKASSSLPDNVCRNGEACWRWEVEGGRRDSECKYAARAWSLFDLLFISMEASFLLMLQFQQ
jgi:hypothetical protein